MNLALTCRLIPGDLVYSLERYSAGLRRSHEKSPADR